MSKGGNRKTATMDFVNGVFLSPPHYQRELIVLINLLCYLSIYRQIYSDSLKKRKDIRKHFYKMLFSRLFVKADSCYLYCIVLSGKRRSSSPLFFHRDRMARMVVRIYRFIFILKLQKVEPRIIIIIPTGFVLFGSKLQTSKVSQKTIKPSNEKLYFVSFKYLFLVRHV